MQGRRGTFCDICRRRVRRYVVIDARLLPPPAAGWGWYEGHLSCIRKQKLKKPHKFGRVHWVGPRRQ